MDRRRRVLQRRSLVRQGRSRLPADMRCPRPAPPQGAAGRERPKYRPRASATSAGALLRPLDVGGIGQSHDRCRRPSVARNRPTVYNGVHPRAQLVEHVVAPCLDQFVPAGRRQIAFRRARFVTVLRFAGATTGAKACPGRGAPGSKARNVGLPEAKAPSAGCDPGSSRVAASPGDAAPPVPPVGDGNGRERRRRRAGRQWRGRKAAHLGRRSASGGSGEILDSPFEPFDPSSKAPASRRARDG